MAVREITRAIKNIIVQGYTEIFKKKEKNFRYAKYAIIVIALAGLSYGGLHVYRYYIYKREASAQKIFVQCLKELDNARSGTRSWYDVEVIFKTGYNQNANSKLAPYFLTFEAEALHNQGKDKEAIKVFNEGLEKISKDSDLYGIYQTKLSIMKLDMKDEALQKEGVAQLEKIACLHQKCEPSSGMLLALYTLGSYYWEKNHIEKAKDIWQKLVAKESQGYKSHYIKLAKEKLVTIA